MDGVGWVWMSHSQFGRYSQLGLLGIGLVAGLVGFGFSWLKKALLDTIHLYTFLWLKGGENGSISYYHIQHNLR